MKSEKVTVTLENNIKIQKNLTDIIIKDGEVEFSLETIIHRLNEAERTLNTALESIELINEKYNNLEALVKEFIIDIQTALGGE